MVIALQIIGSFIIAVGSIIGLASGSGGILLIGSSIVSGVFFLAIGKLITILEKIERKLPNIEQDRSSDQDQQEYAVQSSELEVYDAERETYRFFKQGGHDYIQVRVFKNYLHIADNSFVFNLPNKPEIELFRQKSNLDSADLFEKDDIVFVKLSSLGIQAFKSYKSYKSDSSIILKYS